MKPIFPAVWLLLCLLMSVQPASAVAATEQELQTTGSFHLAPYEPEPVKKATPARKQTAAEKKQAAAAKKRAPVASKSKPASEVVKTELPSAQLDLRLPREMVQELKPVGTVPLPKHDALLPPMFGDKTSSSPFQLNGRLLSNEMQLQRRNEERHEVEGAALDIQFKQ
ncbi:translation initiation factor 2 [Pseudomonas vancouverensis]|uniref:translation initiation factor 2 n=1 Tax=Pseudomonas vancouverensis TaxID=95300 RepID=UPI003CFC0E37